MYCILYVTPGTHTCIVLICKSLTLISTRYLHTGVHLYCLLLTNIHTRRVPYSNLSYCLTDRLNDDHCSFPLPTTSSASCKACDALYMHHRRRAAATLATNVWYAWCPHWTDCCGKENITSRLKANTGTGDALTITRSEHCERFYRTCYKRRVLGSIACKINPNNIDFVATV
jgi:hypothetical protein